MIICTLVTSCNTTEPKQDLPDYPLVVIERSGQQPLVIENDGSPSRQALFDQAQQLRNLDNEIKQWQQHSEGDSTVLKSMINVMIQNREDAIEELEKAWIATNSRSWGSVSEHVESANRNIESVRSALGDKVPGSIYCQTQISSINEDSYIHYLPEGVYRDGGEDWISYTQGAKIKIGNYRFRVSSQDKLFDEKVTILQDPFVHVIQPR